MSDLLVLHEMVNADLDISEGTTITNLQKVKTGGLVTIEVDDTTFQKLTKSANGGKIYGATLLVVNKEEFDQVAARLNAETK